jgi:urease accessory protein
MAAERNVPDEVRDDARRALRSPPAARESLDAGEPSPGAQRVGDASSPRAGWAASLDLEFAARGSRTYLAKRASVGPLVVQRPFYPEGDVAHVYLVHPPGGVVGGDQLQLNVLAKEGAHALITTPAATKFYRSDGRVARQRQEIVAPAASVEWLPQETIVFPDARAQIATRVQLSERSRFVGWEITCYGRPASGLTFGAGRVSQDFELWVNGVPLVLDHLRLDGTADSMRAPFGLAGQPVLGTLFAYPANDTLLSAARAAIDDAAIDCFRALAARGAQSGSSARAAAGADAGIGTHLDAAVSGGAGRTGSVAAACTLVDGALVCRAVGAHADVVRALFIAIWQRVRPGIIGRAAVAPRIWAT